MRRSFLLGLVMLLASVVSISPPLVAQNKTGTDSVKVGDRFYQKKTVYDFGADTIAGDLTRPDGEYLEVRGSSKHSRLIKLREHWKTKMRQSVGDL